MFPREADVSHAACVLRSLPGSTTCKVWIIDQSAQPKCRLHEREEVCEGDPGLQTCARHLGFGVMECPPNIFVVSRCLQAVWMVEMGG